MARSRNKHSRAALRARSRRPRKQGSSRWFAVTISLVCVLGVLGVLFLGGVVDDDEASASGPAVGDHWHAALGVNVCGEWLPVPQEFSFRAGSSSVRAGVHTHGDGFIHIHPAFSSEAGDNATLGLFLANGGWSASPDGLSLWTGPSFAPDRTEWADGDRCPDENGEPGEGEPGRVVFEVNCLPVPGDPSDHKLTDQEVVAIGFLPRGQEMGAPPNAASAPAPDAGEAEPEAIDQEGCRPSAANNPGVVDPAPTAPPTAPADPPTTQQ